jgi:hypothetical protein
MSGLVKPKHLRTRVLGGVFVGVRMDALARKFHDTHDMNVKDEIERLARERGKLKEPWVFRSK